MDSEFLTDLAEGLTDLAAIYVGRDPTGVLLPDPAHPNNKGVETSPEYRNAAEVATNGIYTVAPFYLAVPWDRPKVCPAGQGCAMTVDN